MRKANFSDDFKRDAVRQITERGYPVAEVSQRLGVSQRSLYEWRKKFAASNTKGSVTSLQAPAFRPFDYTIRTAESCRALNPHNPPPPLSRCAACHLPCFQQVDTTLLNRSSL